VWISVSASRSRSWAFQRLPTFYPVIKTFKLAELKGSYTPIPTWEEYGSIPDRLAVTKAECDTNLQDGTARCAQGPWSSALHLVSKDSVWRQCGDYSLVQYARTIPDRYPIRHTGLRPSPFRLQHLQNWPGESVSPNPCPPWRHPEKCDTTHFGRFEFSFMSFGLRNAAQTFQRCMDDILKDLDFFFDCLDDIFAFSHSPNSTTNILTEMKTYGILLNPSKCIFRVPEVSFLGYKISSQGSHPLLECVADLQASSSSEDRRLTPTFLGNAKFLPVFPPPRGIHLSISARCPFWFQIQGFWSRLLERGTPYGVLYRKASLS